MKYKIDSYAVVSASGEIIALDSGINCQKTAKMLNNKNSKNSPYKAVYLDISFESNK